ncbi:MAG: hypothetical protein GYA29_00445 [Methanothrix sp.]|nr:hypothetical protein [Methanothrix sp.]
MKDTEIIEAIIAKLSVDVGRHLYGIVGTYRTLDRFADRLQEAKTSDGQPFPAPTSVNKGILSAIPDDEFRKLVENEARKPEPTKAHINRAFEKFLRHSLMENGLVVLSNLELVFAYDVDLNPLRTLATDQQRVILLLPGRRAGDKIIMFSESGEDSYLLPTNLIADDHIWSLNERP